MKIKRNNAMALIIFACLVGMAGIVTLHGCGVKPYEQPAVDNALVTGPTGTTSGTLKSIAITRPLADTLDAGLLSGKTDYFVATGTYLDVSTSATTTQDITTLVTWTSSDPATANVKTYRTGLGMGIMGNKVGIVTITATLDGVSASIPLTIVQNTGY